MRIPKDLYLCVFKDAIPDDSTHFQYLTTEEAHHYNEQMNILGDKYNGWAWRLVTIEDLNI